MTSDSASLDLTPDCTAQNQDTLQRAHESSLLLAQTPGCDRSLALREMASALQQAQDEILEANTLDLEASQDMAVPDLIQEWLKLTPERIMSAVSMLRHLANLPDPLQRVMATTYGEDENQTYVQPMPLGVIALIYEALPELAAIATGLCICTGNSLVLRGGSEASYSNRAIVSALQQGLDKTNLPVHCVVDLGGDEGTSLKQLVTQDRWINLIIPYGRPSLLQKVTQQATAPVLRTGMGNCYLYWSASGRLDTVRWIIIDSHASEPDPVNAVEKVLLSEDLHESSILSLWNSLRDKGFNLRLDESLASQFPDYPYPIETEWRHPYLNKTVAFHRVHNLEEAVHWMNQHSSGHADVLVSESYGETRWCAQHLNSAICYINTSPRFYRSPYQGMNVALGMSNQKGHRRGRIGLDTLTTHKKIVLGNGGNIE